jgi:hypothetical protein
MVTDTFLGRRGEDKWLAPYGANPVLCILRLWHVEDRFTGGVCGVHRTRATPVADIAATAALEHIVPRAPMEVVVVCPAQEPVIARVTEEDISPRAARQVVIPTTTPQAIITVFAEEPVATRVPPEKVVAGATTNNIVPREAIDDIVTIEPNYHVIAVRPNEEVVASSPDNGRLPPVAGGWRKRRWVAVVPLIEVIEFEHFSRR